METFKNLRRSSGPSWINLSSWRGEKHAVNIAEDIRVFSYFVAVNSHLAAVFEDARAYLQIAVHPLGFGGDFGKLAPVADKLFISAAARRSARAKVKNSLRAVGFALRVSAENDVESVGELNVFIFVISEIF